METTVSISAILAVRLLSESTIVSNLLPMETTAADRSLITLVSSNRHSVCVLDVLKVGVNVVSVVDVFDVVNVLALGVVDVVAVVVAGIDAVDVVDFVYFAWFWYSSIDVGGMY